LTLKFDLRFSYREQHQDQVIAAAKNVLSGKTIPMDIVRVYNSHNIYYSFLSIGWGLIADIDIESERLRILGGNRFTVWALVRTLSLRRYPGRLHFRPVPGFDCNRLHSNQSNCERKGKRDASRNRTRTTLSVQSCESNESSCELEFSSSESNQSTAKRKNKKGRSFSLNLRTRFRKSSTIDSCEEALEHCPRIEQQSPSEYLDVQLTKYKRIDTDDLTVPLAPIPSERASHMRRLSPRLRRLSSESSRNSSAAFAVTDDCRSDTRSPASSDSIGDLPTLTSVEKDVPIVDPAPNLSQPPPSDWKTIEGDFVLVYATYQTHISHDCIIAPNARPDDNVIWLLYLTGNLISFFIVQSLLLMFFFFLLLRRSESKASATVLVEVGHWQSRQLALRQSGSGSGFSS
jgi:hypothetical protein